MLLVDMVKKNIILPKRFLLQDVDELRSTYKKQSLWRYIEIALSFLIFLICGNIILNYYDLISTVKPDLGFFMVQTLTTILLVTGVLLSFDSINASRNRKTQLMLIDLMIQLRINENDNDIMNSLYEMLKFKVEKVKTKI